MRIYTALLISILITQFSFSQNETVKRDSFPNNGFEKKNSAYFRDRFMFNDLANYLDNLNDFVTYESETTGSFNQPDALVFSVSGNSYRWNKYYLNGFRINSRFASGSALFTPDMYSHSLNLNYYNSSLFFDTDSIIPNSISASYNAGGLGGISPGTKQFINLLHKTAQERLYKPIEYRNKIKSAGEIQLNYALDVDGKKYMQQLYVGAGTRMLVDFDEFGINDYYPEDFYKVQLSGQLPLKPGKLFDNTNYILNISQRDNLYNEFYFGKNETAKNNSYNFAVYGSKKTDKYQYTSGITLATNYINHNNLNFNRNIIDQDGEGFEPWYVDGYTSEISHSITYEKKIAKNLQLTFDGYNSLIHFSPENSTFQNAIYSKNIYTDFTSLYIYNWNSKAFTSGLLENTLSLKWQKKLSSKSDIRANADVTLDGMLLSSKSMIRPNWQGKISWYIHPNNWFSMEVNLSKNRVSFNYDDIKYFSNDYLNGDIYYWKDANGDKTYQESEKSSYFTSTGGKYHTAATNLRQPSYFTFDLPFYARFGNHEFSILNSFTKYVDNWTTRLDKPATDYGYFANESDQQIYFYNNGARNYIVDYYPSEYMTTASPLNFLTNSPFYLSNTLKYQYISNKFLFSLSWSSYMVSGISTLGNGPLHNNMGVYSETSANPNIAYKLLGRLDQDRAYIARILLSYQLTKNLRFSFTGKWKDGQPFTSFNTLIKTDLNGNNQAAMWDIRTKGINPFTGNFGSREDMFFNIDIRAAYQGVVANHKYELQLMMYNIYDFGTELTEYTFQPNSIERLAMSINIPRGLILTAKFDL